MGLRGDGWPTISRFRVSTAFKRATTFRLFDKQRTEYSSPRIRPYQNSGYDCLETGVSFYLVRQDCISTAPKRVFEVTFIIVVCGRRLLTLLDTLDALDNTRGTFAVVET